MSNSFDPMRQPGRASPLIIAALVIAVFALLLSIITVMRPSGVSEAGSSDDSLARVEATGVLRVGYGGYPPYTIAGLNGAPPTGFSVDLVNAIASRASPPLKVEWYQFSFNTIKADLDADHFDFIADPVFMTVPRAEDFAFTTPYSYFGIAVALVRENETRFKTFSDLDQPGINIVLAEGWTSSEYARANLSKPNLLSVPVTGDATTQLDEVLTGRADVALNDVPTVLQYVRAHPGRVKALWLNNPPSTVAGAFVLRKGDVELRNFLSSSIQVLQTDGTINTIDRKWNSLGFFPALTLRPGAGIINSSIATGGAGQ